MKQKRAKWKIVLVLMLAFLMLGFHAPTSVQASVTMPKKLYKLVKGKWYTEASSGGYNVKFTQTRIKYYNRKTGKIAFNYKIKKVTKIKSGSYKGRYRVVFKTGSGLRSYISGDKKATYFDYFGSGSGYKGYSISASIGRGKWKGPL